MRLGLDALVGVLVLESDVKLSVPDVPTLLSDSSSMGVSLSESALLSGYNWSLDMTSDDVWDARNGSVIGFTSWLTSGISRDERGRDEDVLGLGQRATDAGGAASPCADIFMSLAFEKMSKY